MLRATAAKIRHRLLRLLSGSAGRRHERVGSPHLWRMKRQFQIDFLRGQGLAPGHRLIDIGCGTLRGGIPLIEYLEPGHYTGIEVRPEVLEEGRRELHDAGLEAKQPTLVCSDDLSGLALEPADFVWAFSVLIHMPDDVLRSAVGFAARHLKPDGVFLANANVGEEGVPGRWQGFPVVRHPRHWYEDVAASHGLRVQDLGSLADFGHADEGRLPLEQRRFLRFTKA